MSSRILHLFNSWTAQETVLVPLPDLPGQVVEIHSVIGQIQSSSVLSVISYGLYHNVDLSITLGMDLEIGQQWAHLELRTGTGRTQSTPAVIHFPVPYDLVGLQRWDMTASAGTVVGTLSVIYTLRQERNRILWNELRARTSFEQG